MSTPYAVSSDLVSAYPAKSLAIAQFIDGYKTSLAMVQNTQTGTSYTFALADFTKLVTLNNAAAVAVTLPLEATIAWETGTQLRLVNLGAGTVTVAGAVGVTINGTPLTLGQFKGANLIKTGTNTWVLIPFASGVGAAVFSDTPTGTYTGYAYKTFTASSTLNVTQAGFCDLVLCAGGGSGIGTRGGAGGAGGVLQITNAYLPVGTLTVTIGAGGAKISTTTKGNIGNPTAIGQFAVPGGGHGGTLNDANTPGFPGGSGGGGFATGAGGSGLPGAGNAGGSGSSTASNYGSGGGGGAGGVGGNGSGSTAGNGGAGTTTSIAGTTPSSTYSAGSYALGGGGGGGGVSASGTASSGGGPGGSASTAGTDGTVNTGGGGGAAGSDTTTAGSGGSGIVIVRVAV